MSRLTNKDDRGRYYTVEEKILIANEPVNPTTTWIVHNENRRYGSPIEKLGKLEDLEDQLGCPLEVIGKAIKDNCYYNVELGRYSETNIGLVFEDNTPNYVISIDDWENGYQVFLKDYKKTWWLKRDKSE